MDTINGVEINQNKLQALFTNSVSDSRQNPPMHYLPERRVKSSSNLQLCLILNAGNNDSATCFHRIVGVKT